MVTGWLLSKFDGSKPVVASLSIGWQAATGPLTGGWALVHVQCQPTHVEFFKTDEDVIWIGGEWVKVPQEVLSTYAAQLDPNETYVNIGQVIDKLAEWNPRFHLRGDGWVR